MIRRTLYRRTIVQGLMTTIFEWIATIVQAVEVNTLILCTVGHRTNPTWQEYGITAWILSVVNLSWRTSQIGSSILALSRLEFFDYSNSAAVSYSLYFLYSHSSFWLIKPFRIPSMVDINITSKIRISLACLSPPWAFAFLSCPAFATVDLFLLHLTY